MGLLARGIEACGVTTVCLALVRELAVQVKAPRMLYLHWPFGHALGEPGNVQQQLTVLHDMLSLAWAAPLPGLVVELPYRWKRQAYAPVTDWAIMSDACSYSLRATIEVGESHLLNQNPNHFSNDYLLKEKSKNS